MPDAFSRDRGALARQTGHGDVENTYRLQITNSLEQASGYTVRVSGIEGLLVGATSTQSMAVRLVLPMKWAQRHSGETLPVVFQIDPDTAGAHRLVEVKSTFIVPRY